MVCRTYEDRELRFLNEKKEKLKGFDNQLERLRMELEFLRSEDKQAPLRRNQDAVAKLQTELGMWDSFMDRMRASFIMDLHLRFFCLCICRYKMCIVNTSYLMFSQQYVVLAAGIPFEIGWQA